MKKKWYQKTWVIGLLLIIFAPVGIYLMFKHTNWQKNVKIIIAIFASLFFISMMFEDSEAPIIDLTANDYTIERSSKIDKKTIVDQLVSNVSDNRTKLTKEDIDVIGLEEMNVDEIGTYNLKIQVTDEAGNATIQDVIINVEANEADKKAEKEKAEKEKAEKEKAEKEKAEKEKAEKEKAEKEKAEKEKTEKEKVAVDKKEKETKKIGLEDQNALRKAELYGNQMHMSKAGIYDQLTSEYGEGFEAEAAEYAIDNADINYKKNAVEKAKQYGNQMNMSKTGIYDQLISEYGEQFTSEEAQYGIDNVDIDYKKNALKKAQSYSSSMNMSKSAVYDQLVSEYGEGFTADEAQYAIDNLE